MAGKLTSKLKQVKDIIEKEVREEVYHRAHMIRSNARSNAPSPMNPGPYATGALKASAYVSTDDGNDDYEEGKKIAEALNLRIEKRNQYYEKVVVQPEPGKIKAMVGFPTSYAELIEEGFYHVRAGRHIQGQRFLRRAVNDNEKPFFAGIGESLKKAESIHVVTPEMREAEQIARARAQRAGGPSAEFKGALVLSAQAQGVSIEEYVSRGSYDESAKAIEQFGQDARTWLEPKNVSRRERRAQQRAADLIKAQEIKARRRGNQGG